MIDPIYLITLVGVILVSMTLHELMHGLVANFLGDKTAELEGRLTLNPIKHIDPFLTLALPIFLAITAMLTGGSTPIFGGAKPVPFNPLQIRYGEWGVALVALAGPLTNLLLAFVCFGLFVVAGQTGPVAYVMSIATLVNLGFFVFNMLPIPPLDGSRLLYALAPEFVRRGMEAIERYGLMVVFALVLLLSPVLGRFMAEAIGFFLEIFTAIYRAG